ncbi:hypothetical protein [Fructobacillus fructosus]|uniref:hypothetical protein n=1 Tax=Fructobacillus fructosus TaxID=1631 RepID=UPI002DB073F6|nr:unnamed protein product [Fructobacillus fructosus]CAK1251459.1 unnamed protein product [Fructobacillus fructosus]CAK1251715.1 unnamed protein product [Fructobacillus fructosus]
MALNKESQELADFGLGLSGNFFVFKNSQQLLKLMTYIEMIERYERNTSLNLSSEKRLLQSDLDQLVKCTEHVIADLNKVNERVRSGE